MVETGMSDIGIPTITEFRDKMISMGRYERMKWPGNKMDGVDRKCHESRCEKSFRVKGV